MNLYEDQVEFVDKLRESLRKGNRAILGVASPAFGKTVVAGHIIASTINRTKGGAWFLVHRKNLLRQTSKSFWRDKIEHGLITSGKARSAQRVQVGTIGTVYSRLKHLTAPAIMFIDEAHLSRGMMFEAVIKWAKEHGCIVIGLTGTPKRLDGKSLGDIYEDMVEARSTKWLIQQARLSDYDMYTSFVMPDLSEVKSSGGDYNKEQLAGAMDTSVIVGDAVDHWKKNANGLITVCYCVNVKHSISTAAQFNAAGVPAIHVDAYTTEAELKDACEGLASGKYKVLVNCELVIEGFDLSAQVGKDITIECVILLRPTKSRARYLQMVFRALRKKPYPAIILDHSGCANEFGLPDADQEWDLHDDGKKEKSNSENDIKTKECPKCLHIFKPALPACPKCNTEVEVKERRIEVAEGELTKIDKEVFAIAVKERRQEQGQARGLTDLVDIGIRRGMKNPAAWSANVFAARQGRKPTQDEFSQARAYARSAR